MNAKSKVERTLKQVETGVQPSIVNGVAVDQLVQTINAINATPAIAKFKFRVRKPKACPYR